MSRKVFLGDRLSAELRSKRENCPGAGGLGSNPTPRHRRAARRGSPAPPQHPFGALRSLAPSPADRGGRIAASGGETVSGWLQSILSVSASSIASGCWPYFAFGSNLHVSVLEGRRGVYPLAVRPGYVEDYRLAFNILGVPLVEPSFASIEPAKGHRVHGAVFTLDLNGWLQICRTEGVPFGYVLEPVTVVSYDGEEMQAISLRAAPTSRAPWWREVAPSERYRRLIIDGAAQRGLSKEWQEELQRLTSQEPKAAIRKQWMESPTRSKHLL